MKANAVQVRPGAVAGAIHVPGSKSETHRAFLLAAQSDIPCRVEAPLRGEDTDATLSCLQALGARMHVDAGREAAVQFLPSALRPPRTVLDCRNSGTTLRLLTATCARFAGRVTLTGDDSLRARPNGPLLDALSTLGVQCAAEAGKAPVTVQGPLRAGDARLPASTSSQYGSALLLALAAVEGPSTVTLDAPVSSSPYLDVTLRQAASFGLRLREDTGPGRRFLIDGGQTPHAASHRVHGDWSAAAFPIVAAAITAGDVGVHGLDPKSAQGDRAILGIARSFGVRLHDRPDGVRVHGADLVSPGVVDVAATPDLFPALAILAACSRGTTSFTGGTSLRVKESDRIAAMADGLQRMGISCRQTPDGLQVTGGRLQGARVASLGDHRIHMAFALAGLAAQGTTFVDDPACAAVSWPAFHGAFTAAGAGFTLLQGNRTEVAVE